MKKYYARFDMLHGDIIRKKTLEFLKKTRERYITTFYAFNYKEFVEHVPEIEQAFDHHGMRVVQINGFIMNTYADADAHKDPTAAPIRVNVPILNTVGTLTQFWEPKSPSVQMQKKILPNNVTYEYYDYDDLVLMDQVEIDEPILIRPREIHSVNFLSKQNPTPRITLTLILDPLPYHYFPDIPKEQHIPLEHLSKFTTEWGKTKEEKSILLSPEFLEKIS
jgi:hypothetical protein